MCDSHGFDFRCHARGRHPFFLELNSFQGCSKILCKILDRRRNPTRKGCLVGLTEMQPAQPPVCVWEDLLLNLVLWLACSFLDKAEVPSDWKLTLREGELNYPEFSGRNRLCYLLVPGRAL